MKIVSGFGRYCLVGVVSSVFSFMLISNCFAVISTTTTTYAVDMSQVVVAGNCYTLPSGMPDGGQAQSCDPTFWQSYSQTDVVNLGTGTFGFKCDGAANGYKGAVYDQNNKLLGTYWYGAYCDYPNQTLDYYSGATGSVSVIFNQDGNNVTVYVSTN